MANNIVQLTDDTNNNIFPIAGGMASDSITTAMLQDGAVTEDKFADKAVSQAIITANNLVPAEDTTMAWINLFGGTSGMGYFITCFNVDNSFTNQPSRYGWMETIFKGNGIYQRWTTFNAGPVYYRAGNQSGWNPTSGAFKAVLDGKTGFTTVPGTHIPSNSDLNTFEFIQPGIYYNTTNAYVATLINCPTTNAFRMEVYNNGSDAIISDTQTWKYVVRKITDINGRIYIQNANSNAADPPVWSYGAWRRIDSQISMTTNDPGEGATLAAGQFIAVYSA